MLAWLCDWLMGADSAVSIASLGVIFRACAAGLFSLLVVLLAGPRTILWLRARVQDPNTSPSDRLRELHAAKSATPTMGGLLVLAALVSAVLLLGDLSNHYVQIGFLLVVGLAIVGMLDDLKKVVTGRGETPRAKLIGQTIVALPVALGVYFQQTNFGGSTELHVPLVGSLGTLGVWFVPLAVLALVGSSNAVNLTDGLDGLAAGCLVGALAVLALAVNLAGDGAWASSLGAPAVSGASEMLVPAVAALGAVVGFLWFNRHPARIFLGDTGSLALGGLLGYLAIVARQEMLLVLVAGVFVVETASVIVQLASLRWFGRRVLLCAPLHHHFQFRGWSEPRVVANFWMASVLCAALGLAALVVSRPDQVNAHSGRVEKLVDQSDFPSPTRPLRK